MSPTLCVKITWIRLIITRGVLCLYWLRLFQNNRVPQYKLSFNSSKVKHVCVSQRCNTMLICSARARKDLTSLCANSLPLQWSAEEISSLSEEHDMMWCDEAVEMFKSSQCVFLQRCFSVWSEISVCVCSGKAPWTRRVFRLLIRDTNMASKGRKSHYV